MHWNHVDLKDSALRSSVSSWMPAAAVNAMWIEDVEPDHLNRIHLADADSAAPGRCRAAAAKCSTVIDAHIRDARVIVEMIFWGEGGAARARNELTYLQTRGLRDASWDLSVGSAAAGEDDYSEADFAIAAGVIDRTGVELLCSVPLWADFGGAPEFDRYLSFELYIASLDGSIVANPYDDRGMWIASSSIRDTFE